MVTADVDVLADKGLPELSHPVDGSVPLVGLDDLSGQLRVTDSPQSVYSDDSVHPVRSFRTRCRRPRSGRRLRAYPVSSPPSRCLIE